MLVGQENNDASADWLSSWFEVKGAHSFEIVHDSVAGTPNAEFAVEVSNSRSASAAELSGSRTTLDEGSGSMILRMTDEPTYTYVRLRYEHKSANAGQFSVYAHGLYSREIQ